MTDIIQLLPDSVANQIAAGEVVQRPASVVKELMENAIDAGAGNIQVILKNVGKSTIQIIDDGKGMSPIDARMAFERHATSKISSAQDLFSIRTLGFRGEALPSIASVAEIEMKTRRQEDELGTCISISASELKSQNTVNVPAGTNIAVKNLFYNVPARRKFLKSDTTELRNIINEFLRVALAYPEISFSLLNNGSEIYQLPPSGLRQRIVNAFGKSMNAKLIHICCETSLVMIKGYVCSPEQAKKTYGEQYFFVNNRFMKHNFFHKAVMEAYSGLISPEALPSYFLYFTVQPDTIDVNIHPTKTEIKFQDENDFFQILMAGIREVLGKFNIKPPLDFDTEGSIETALPESKDHIPYTPKVNYKPDYNPFNYKPGGIGIEDSNFEKTPAVHTSGHHKKVPANWETLFEDLKEKPDAVQTTLPEFSGQAVTNQTNNGFLQLKGRFLVTLVEIGLMLIDQKRAHERILFEKYMDSLTSRRINSQKCLFPETLELCAADFALIGEIREELESLGFELNVFGKNCYAIYATPSDLSYTHAKKNLMQLIEHYKNTEGNIKNKMHERIALATAKAAAIDYNTPLSNIEMAELVSNLFACKHHKVTAEGKTIIRIIDEEEINNRFK